MEIQTENVTVVDSYTLASPFERIIAVLIDLTIYAIIAFALSRLLGGIGLSWVGVLIAYAYLILRDNLKFLNYQSLGKKVMKLKVIRSNDKLKITLGESVKRNFIFLPNLLYSLWPSYLFAVSTVIFILILLEMYLMYTNSDHQRLGDQYADTLVVENLEVKG